MAYGNKKGYSKSKTVKMGMVSPRKTMAMGGKGKSSKKGSRKKYA